MARLRHIDVWLVARTTFALAGGLLLAFFSLENSARASCGDYVFVRNASGKLVRASTLMKNHGKVCTGPFCPDLNHQEAEEPELAVPDDLPVELPCQGPHCSGRSGLPLAPLPTPAPRSSQESTALLLKSCTDSPKNDSRFDRAPAASGHELHYPQTIFHPPR